MENIDWPRHLRAWQAERIQRIEARRRMQINGDADNLTAEEWEAIKEHDALVAEDTE